MDVEYVGHPLLDALQQHTDLNPDVTASSRVIALLPGSRRQEVQRILPEDVGCNERFP